MHAIPNPEIQALAEAAHQRPAISIILPFEPRMSGSSVLEHLLNAAGKRVEKELRNNYQPGIVLPLMQKMNRIFDGLNYNTDTKSIAIYLSPAFEKVIYMDLPAEEKIIVNESFEIRDPVYCKKQLHKYLVLQLSNGASRIFLGNSTRLIQLVSNSFDATEAYAHEPPSKTANFSDNNALRETQMHKFLHQADHALQLILNAYPLPIFVIGPTRILGHFKKISKHKNTVIEYIHGDYFHENENKLEAVLKPHVDDWKDVIQKNLLSQLDAAAGANKLASGIENVWRDAMDGKGRLLVIEKNFMCAPAPGDSEDRIFKSFSTVDRLEVPSGSIDDLIAKILQSGGDVQFTDEGALSHHDHIALIKYY